MDGIFIKIAVSALAKVLPFTLRRVYPPERIADLVTIRISSESEGIEFWNGDIPKARVWVEITNRSPFTLELDRAYGSFEYGSNMERFWYLKREEIPPTTEVRILLEASLTKEHVVVIQRLMASNPNPVVNINAGLLCKVHNFCVNRRLQTAHHKLVNFKVADAAL